MHDALLAGSAGLEVRSCGIAPSGEALVVRHADALEPNTTLHAKPNLLLIQHLRTIYRSCIVKVDARGTHLFSIARKQTVMTEGPLPNHMVHPAEP